MGGIGIAIAIARVLGIAHHVGGAERRSGDPQDRAGGHADAGDQAFARAPALALNVLPPPLPASPPLPLRHLPRSLLRRLPHGHCLAPLCDLTLWGPECGSQ